MKGKNTKRVFVHDPRKLFTPHINKDTTTTRYSLPNEKPSFFRGNQRPYHIISLMVPIFVPNYKKALCCLRGNVLLKVSQAPPLQRVAVSILLSLGHISAQRKKTKETWKAKHKETRVTSAQEEGEDCTRQKRWCSFGRAYTQTDGHVLYILIAAPVEISPPFCPLSPSVMYHSRTVT